MKRHKEVKNGFLSKFFLRVFIVLGILLLFFIFYKLSHQIYYKKNINQEIVLLEKERDRLIKKNSELKEVIDYFNTEQYKEQEAREKLNLIREGEEVIEIKEKEIIVKNKKDDEKPDFEINQPNYYYWWHYFFKME